MKKALFLDRDGVINEEKNYVHRIEDFVVIEGIVDVLKHFQGKGYLITIITNQAGIGRGYYTEQDFQILNDWMLNLFLEKGVKITKVYFCPHHPEHGIGMYKQNSFFRKPNPGMILQAQRELQIDMEQSILVGDKESDIQAGISAGIKHNVLLTKGESANISSRAAYIINDIRELKCIFG